jgi:site-specific recombinase XerD
MYDLFGRCRCVLCRALEVAVRVIDEGHPTDINLFCEYVCTFIVNSRDGQRSTRREAVRHIMRFRKWCTQNGITDITMVKQEDIEAFVHWPVMMGGRARRPGWSTMRNRRTYMRRAFKAARELGYEIIDPTIDVVVIFDRTVEANLCTDDDIERLREGTPVQLFSNTWVSVIALAEAGATNSEVQNVRASDVELDEGVVHLAGNARVDERINPLTEWGTMVLRERVVDLGPEDFVVTNGDDRQCSESTVSQMFKHIANYANLGSRGLNINSVRGWRARAVYEETGRIQDAALFLGNRSLDSTALLIGLKWREPA